MRNNYLKQVKDLVFLKTDLIAGRHSNRIKLYFTIPSHHHRIRY